MLSAFQGEKLAEHGSDCKSKGYLTVKLPTTKRIHDFDYRYILKGNDLELLTPESIEKYAGKTVQMRSPMYCCGIGKNRQICNKCAGEYYYKIDKLNIGLSAPRVGTSCTRLNMKKFHENLIKTQQINVDELFISMDTVKQKAVV